MGASANAVVQNAETVGTSLRTMALRIRGAKEELEALGETEDGTVLTTAKLRKEVKALTGFDILEKDNQTFKSTYDILVGIGEKWDDLTDLQQAGLAESLAGKRGANVFFSIMGNLDDLQKAYVTAENSAGSAEREQENWSKSIQFSIDKLKAAAEELASDTIESSWIKDGVELLTKFIELLDKLISKVGSLGPILGTVLTIASSGGIKGINEEIGKYGWGSFEGSSPAEYTFDTAGYEAALAKSSGLDPHMFSTSAMELRIGAEGVEKLKDEYGNLKPAIKGATGAAKIFKNALISIGISAAISFAVKLGEAHKELALAAEKAGEAIKNNSKSIDSSIDAIKQEYAVLSDSSSSFEDQVVAKQNLYDIQKDLIKQYPDELRGIDLIKGAYEDQEDVLNRLVDLKSQYYQNTIEDFNNNTISSLGDVFSQKTANGINNVLYGRDWNANLDEVISSYEDYSVNFGNGLDESLTNAIKNSLKSDGEIRKLSSFTKGFTNSLNSIKGPIEDVYDDLVLIQEKAEELNDSGQYDSLIKSIGATKSEIRSYRDQYQELYDSYILYEKVLGQNPEELYAAYNEAYNKYQSAESEEALAEAQKDIQDIFAKVDTSGWDEAVIDWFHRLRPELEDEIANLSFERAFAKDKNGIKSSIKAYVSQFKNSEDIENYTLGAGSAAQDSAYEFLSGLGVAISEVVALAVEEGFIQSGAREKAEKLILQNFSNPVNEAKSLADIAKAQEFINGLTEKQLIEWNDIVATIYDVDDAIRAYKKSAIEVNEKATPRDAIDSLLELNGGFDVLGTIYKDIKDGGAFDFKQLDSKKFSEAFKGLETEYSDFIATVSKNPKDINATQEAFNNLVTAFINNDEILQNINEDNIDVVQSMLEMYGVTNAQEVASNMLAESVATLHKEEQVLALEEEYKTKKAGELKDATYEDVSAFLDEADAAIAVRVELANAAAAENIYNNSSLDLAGKISELEKLAGAYGLVATQAILAANAENLKEAGQNETRFAGSSVSYNQAAQAIYKSSIEALANAQANEVPKITAIYGGTKDAKSSGSGSDTKDKILEFDKRYIDVITKKRQKYLNVIEDETKAYDDQLDAIEDVISVDEELISAYDELAANKRRAIIADEAALHADFDASMGVAEVDKLIRKFKEGAIDFDEFRVAFEKGLKNGGISTDQDQHLENLKDDIESEEKAEENADRARQERLQHIVQKYEIAINQIKTEFDKLDDSIKAVQDGMDIRTTSGSEIVTERDYSNLIDISKRQIENLKRQREVLQDELDELEDEGLEYSSIWYGVYGQLNDIDESIRQCKKDQAEWNEEIKNLPIKRLDRYIELLTQIKKLVENFEAEDDALGMPKTASEIATKYKINVKLIGEYKKKITELEKNLKTYTYGTDKFNETASSISQAKDEVSGLIQEMEGYAQQLLQLPIDRLDKQTAKLTAIKGALAGVQADNDNAISSVISLLDNEIERVNKAYQERIDALEEGTEEEEKQLAVERAKLNLERQRGQLTQKVLKDGEWQWQADTDAIASASKELNDAVREKAIYDLTAAKDEIVEALEETKNKWEELTSEITNEINFLKANEIFGVSNWQDLVNILPAA